MIFQKVEKLELIKCLYAKHWFYVILIKEGQAEKVLHGIGIA